MYFIHYPYTYVYVYKLIYIYTYDGVSSKWPRHQMDPRLLPKPQETKSSSGNNRKYVKYIKEAKK